MLPAINVSEIDNWCQLHEHFMHVTCECSQKRVIHFENTEWQQANNR